MMQVSLIVIGSLNTDIVAAGVKRFPQAGEHVYGRELMIGPGGKSRNIAAMAGVLLPRDKVAMVGRTAEDMYGLWKPPIQALQQAGVNIDFVQVVPLAEARKLPAVALIPVNEQGENQIFVLPGVSDDFNHDDIDAARSLFDAASRKQGLLALTLECPLETARYAVTTAARLDIKVILDPGGIEPGREIGELLQSTYLVKPNAHEAKIMTGVEVMDFASARMAAQKLKETGVENVLITHGEKGGYLFTPSGEMHIQASETGSGSIKDATGCGDQTMATLCAYLQRGAALEAAAKTAILSGTLQFYKSGIQPITIAELEAQL